jgi:hypothetical protein
MNHDVLLQPALTSIRVPVCQEVLLNLFTMTYIPAASLFHKHGFD